MRFRQGLAPFALVLSACQTIVEPVDAPAEGQAGPSQTAEIWTDAFEPEAVLVAEDVWIEGPPGLLQHVVVAQNARDFDQVVRMTPEGFFQQSQVKPELAGGAATAWSPLRAQLDNLIIAPSHRIRVLERFEPTDVIVRARGRVVWKRTDGSGEQRGDRVELVGQLDG